MAETAEKTEQERQDSAAPAAEAPAVGNSSGVTEELAAAKQKLEEMSQRIEKLERNAHDETAKITAVAENTSGRETSRMVITGGLALIGAKLGAATGFKVAGGKEAISAYKSGGMQAVIDSMMHMNIKTAKTLAVYSAVGGAVGALLTGAFGWARGDRIKDASDLIAHPLRSAKALLQSDAAYRAEHPEYKPRGEKKAMPQFDNVLPEPTVRENLGQFTGKLVDAPQEMALSR